MTVSKAFRRCAAAIPTIAIAFLLNSCQKETSTPPSAIEVQSSVESLAYSPDGKSLASGGTITKLWDLSSGSARTRPLAGNASGGSAVAFSPDSRLLASTDTRIDAIGITGVINVWDVTTGKLAFELTGHKREINALSFNSDGRLLASGDDEKRINLWDAYSGQLVRSIFGLKHEVTAVSFSANGLSLAGATYDGSIKIWDVASGRLRRDINVGSVSARLPTTVMCVAFSPVGHLLASGVSSQLQLWDPATGAEVHRFSGHNAAITSIAFSPNGKILASGSRDQTIMLWDVSSGKLLKTLTATGSAVSSVAFSPDGSKLASGSPDNTIAIWDVSSGKQLQTLCWHQYLDGHGSSEPGNKPSTEPSTKP